jgi:tripartite-type tricarboxylate transporter receptor subunit TctC
MSKLLKDPGVRYEPLEFDYVGSLGPVPYYLWVRADTGIKSLEDLRKSERTIVFGGLAQRASNYVVPALLVKDGWPVKALHGYKGTANIMLAIEQKEVDGMYASTSTLRSNRGDLIDDKVIIPIAADAKDSRNLPVLPEHMSKETRGVFSLVTAPSTWGVPTIAPPGTDKKALSILRAAYMKMTKDKAFLADAAKRGIFAEQPNSGEQVYARIKDLLEGADKTSVDTYLGYVQRKKK